MPSKGFLMNRILIKLSGEIFSNSTKDSTQSLAHEIAEQMITLQKRYHVGIVMGGGNLFRGASNGVALGLRQPVADSVGMLATIMNGLVLQEIFHQHKIESTLLSATEVPGVTQQISQQRIDTALDQGSCLIFSGGTGCPFVTTDTNAIIRALQMGAKEVWKATKTDYVYTGDPSKNAESKVLPKLSYQTALDQRLGFMDATALTLARDHNLTTRVFNIFAPQALITASLNTEFGSTIT
jgi:uridylate kinase